MGVFVTGHRSVIGWVLGLVAAVVWGFATVPVASARGCSTGTDDGGSLLALSPAPNLSPTMPVGGTVQIVATPLVGGHGHVEFTVCGTNSRPGAARPLDETFPGLSGPRSATLTYSDTKPGSDTILASYVHGGHTVTATTSVRWARPATGCPIGLPRLLQALGCTSAGRFVATAYNTGGCLSSFALAGKLVKLLKLADAGKLARGLAADSALANLAHDMVELEEDGVSFKTLVKTARDAHSVKDFVSSLASLMKDIAKSGDANQVALDLADVTGLKPCVNLLVGSVGPTPPPPAPPTPPSVPGILGLWHFPHPVAGSGDTTPSEIEFIRGQNGQVVADGVTVPGDDCGLGTYPHAFADFTLRSGGYWTGSAGWVRQGDCDALGAWPSAMRVLINSVGVQTLVQCSAPPGTFTQPSISPGGEGSPGSECWTSAGRPAGGWGSAIDLGAGPLGSGPSAGGDAASEQFVFWQGTDGALWDQWTLGSAAWNGPARIVSAGKLGSAPAVAVQPSSVQDVFWKGTDGNLYETWHTSSWHATINLGAGPLGSGPAAGIDKAGDQFVFWKGTDGHLWDTWFSHGAWHGPAKILAAGTIGSAPTVAVTPSGVQHVFWEGTDGNLWESTYNDGWSPPANLHAGPLGSAPAAGADIYGRIFVFWRGTDGSLWDRWYAGGLWNGPVQITAAGIMGSAPTVAVEASGEQDVFWKGTDGDLWETIHS